MSSLYGSRSITPSAERNKPWMRTRAWCCILREMRHDALASQLVRALRGKRSQPALSRRLGYNSNVVYAWESGRRAPLATDFVRLLQRTLGKVAPKLQDFAGVPLPSEQDLAARHGIAALLSALGRERSLLELARLLRKDRTTVARWLHGDTEPKLPELLAFIEHTTQRLLEFVSLFVDPEALAETRRAYRDLVEQRRLAYELPWSHAVLRALEVSRYRALPKHEPGVIAALVGISEEEEARYLKALEACKQIRRVRGRYVVRRVLTVDTRASEARNRQLKAHWSQVAHDRYVAAVTPAETLFSYNLFAIDRRGYERIRELHLAYYERVRELVAEAKDADCVVLLNLQLVPLGAMSSRRTTRSCAVT